MFHPPSVSKFAGVLTLCCFLTV